MIKFKKMHGCGNDFVIIDARNQDVNLDAEQIKKICDRNFGVGCDLLTIITGPDQEFVLSDGTSESVPSDCEAAEGRKPSDGGVPATEENKQTAVKPDIKAIFLNADGSESGACGNATRCVADLLLNETGKDAIMIETGGGLLNASRADGGLVTIDMGEPAEIDQTLTLEGEPTGVNMGNPHCVLFVDDVQAVNLQTIGPLYENHDLFPNRTNVEFVQILGENKLRQRTWERGVGETLACGSGACAVAVAAVTKNITTRKVEIILDGGTLHIEWRESDNHVLMTGPVAYVFDGEFDERF